MKKFNAKHAKKQICSFIHKSNVLKDLDYDSDGRIVIFTNLFKWSDGFIYDRPEEEAEIFEEFVFDGASTTPPLPQAAPETLTPVSD